MKAFSIILGVSTFAVLISTLGYAVGMTLTVCGVVSILGITKK